MWKTIALCTVCVLAPQRVWAQDEIIKDFGQPQIEKFVKDVLKGDLEKKMEMAKQFFVVYPTPDGQFDVYLRNAPKKCVFFIYNYNGKANLERLNAWNGGLHVTHAYLNPNGSASLRASLNLEGGIAYRQLTEFYDQIQAERILFQGN